MLALLLDLARLADTLAALRQGQERYHQAEAALAAATTLRDAANATGRITVTAPLTGPEMTAGPTHGPTSPPTPKLSTPDSPQQPDHSR